MKGGGGRAGRVDYFAGGGGVGHGGPGHPSPAFDGLPGHIAWYFRQERFLAMSICLPCMFLLCVDEGFVSANPSCRLLAVAGRVACSLVRSNAMPSGVFLLETTTVPINTSHQPSNAMERYCK